MYDKFFEEKDKIQIEDNEFDLNKIKNRYEIWIKEFNTDDYIKKLLIWDYELISCKENSLHNSLGSEDRFSSHLTWSNGTKWPDIKNFEEERIAFYEECANRTKNKVMKIRYFDYLLEYGKKEKKYSFANQLSEELISVCTIKDNNYFNYLSKISRLVDISVKFNNRDVMRISEKILIDELDNLVEKKNYRWILEMAEVLRYLCYYKNEKRIELTTINKIINYLQISRTYFSEKKETTMYQNFSWELLNWYKAEKYNNEDITKILINIGEAYELESEYQGGRNEKSNIVKAHFLECAIQHYIDIGENSRVPALKVKVKESYKDMESNNELKEFSTNLEIPKEIIDKEVGDFIKKDIEESFEILSTLPRFIPDNEEIRNSVKEISEETVFINLVSLSRIYEGRKIFQAKDDEESFKHLFNQQYDINLKVIFGILYTQVWKALINQGLTCEMVIERITKWDYMDEEDKIIVGQGIRNFFNNDYISSLHILIPKFESCFRKFFEYGGYATTSIKSKVTQHEQNFNDFLTNNDFVKENIDEDFLFFIKYVMVEDIGYNLRNNIAHGLANLQTFNSTINHIVVYMFFMLTNLIWKPIDYVEN